MIDLLPVDIQFPEFFSLDLLVEMFLIPEENQSRG